ncbi:diguanylate cyclase [uncultured Paraglaciecola sp.]|uniref:diguanylate cyclase n=1 Tax=uncultured Paraglaciecola sp. TaxID=1765024 RepID=UPI0030DC31AC|tara:strand:+ start:94018 stop:95679 length:1662 start_codon:yes stop_codon:yes gene_type:complete
MSSKLEQKLAEFRITFIAEFEEKIAVLIELWSEARSSHSIEAIKQFRFEVHSLKGSSGTLNFITLSDRLGMIEEEVAPCEEKINQFKSIIPFIDRHMNSMIEASRINPNPLLVLKTAPEVLGELREPLKNNIDITTQSYRDIKIALIDDNETTAVHTKLLAGFGFAISHFKSIEKLEEVLALQTFNLVLIDIDNTTSSLAQMFAYAGKLRAIGTDVFVLSSSSSFENRLAAVRARVNEFLLKPLNITTLVSKIRKNFKLDLIRPYRILLLDDQASVGIFYKTLLEDEHVEVLAINQPEMIMAELESFHPDVFLLDMHMPNISGLEIARILRQQSKYDYVPIIFLTADEDINTKLAVLECGADDVIPKNTPPNLIVQQVDSRIQRGQEIRYLASRDSLTGVLNHGQIMDAAAHALRLSSRQQNPTVVVMIDLDHFKQVNDKYGHIAGDKVLIALGQLLLQSVRDTDYVGRYGGEEFMVVFSDTNPSIIETKMNHILSAFLQINFTVADTFFQSSFSAGLASSTRHEKLSEFISSADAALYKAKKAGRSRICVDA